MRAGRPCRQVPLQAGQHQVPPLFIQGTDPADIGVQVIVLQIGIRHHLRQGAGLKIRALLGAGVLLQQRRGGDQPAQAEAGAIHDIAYLIGSTSKDIGGGKLLQEAGARWCQNLLDLGRKPGYFYYFTRSLPGDDAGAFHSCELWYEFETMDRCWRPWEPCDRELCRCLSGYWANFAKTGDPNGEGLPRWEPYTDGCHAPMELGETVGMMP